MSLFSKSNSEYSPTAEPSSLQTKEQDNCLICKVMRIRHEKADLVKWIFSTDKSTSEKAELASSLTGITFDKEVIECIQDPDIQKFLFSK